MKQRARRYPSDTSDAGWAILEPLVPPPKSGPVKGGRPAWPRRAVIDAIFYVVRTGCAWRQLPADFPPWQTVYGHFAAWRADGTLEGIHARLRDAARAAEDRDPIPSAGSIDSQAIRTADTAGAATTGFDMGRKRHVIDDTLGLLLAVVVTAASIQDRDGAVPVTRRALREHRGIGKLWADGGYAGRFVTWTKTARVREPEACAYHRSRRPRRPHRRPEPAPRCFRAIVVQRRRTYSSHPRRELCGR